MITLQLRKLEADGIISRRVHAGVPPGVEYDVTEKARGFAPIIGAMRDWSRSFNFRETRLAKEQTTLEVSSG